MFRSKPSAAASSDLSARSGFVSRTCILAILGSKGKKLPPGTIEVMIRWGGWQAVTGARTVLRIYARKVIDRYLAPYSLSLGYELSDEEWEQKRRAYLGVPKYLEEPVVDRGRNRLPFQVRVHACAPKSPDLLNPSFPAESYSRFLSWTRLTAQCQSRNLLSHHRTEGTLAGQPECCLPQHT